MGLERSMSEINQLLRQAAKDATACCPSETEKTLYWLAANEIQSLRQLLADAELRAELVTIDGHNYNAGDVRTLMGRIDMLKKQLAETKRREQHFLGERNRSRVDAIAEVREEMGKQRAARGPEGWRTGVEAVARLIEEKADNYAQVFGSADMGAISFGRGSRADAKMDYYCALVELAEEIRAMLQAPQPPAGGMLDEALPALRKLELACDTLANIRTSEQYLSMIDAGQAWALEALDEARREARALLAAQPQLKNEGKV